MAGSLRRAAPALLPATVALGLCGYWIAREGGYAPTDWYPGLFLLAGLLVAAVLGLGGRRPPLDRPALVALTAFAAYVGWSYASILWAADQGTALEGSNRALLFFLAFALFASLPWRAGSALVLVLAFTLVIGVAGVITAIRLGTAAEPVSLFIDARLASPLGYQNASAALWTAGALPALALAAARELPVVVRGVLLGLSTMLIELAVLGQSRGWLVTLPLVLAATLVVVPHRLRFIGAAALAAGGAVLALPALLDVYEAGGSRSRADAAAGISAEAPDAALAVLVTTLAITAVGTVIALADRGLSPPPRVRRAMRAAAAAACALALLAGAGAGWAATDGDPFGSASDAWDEFKAGENLPDPGTTTRFGNVGSARYDFWRAGVSAARERPLRGLGQDNYAAEYLSERRSTQEPRWVHSLALRLAVHTGLVGLALFCFAMAATAFAVVRRRRRAPDRDTALAGVCLLPLAVWTIFGSVDWFWEFPALSAPALALAGAGLSLVRRSPTRCRRAPAAAAPAAAIALLVIALGAAGPPYLAERHVERAESTWGSDPGDAFRRLDDAASLDPLSTRPHRVAGLIALGLGRPREAARHFRRLLELTPGDWFAHFELALIASAGGDDAAARSQLLRARDLNPQEPLIQAAFDRLGTARPLSVREAHEELVERARRRVGGAAP